MTTSTPTEPAGSPFAKFNPGWVGAIVTGVSALALLGGGWLAIERHSGEIKELQVWKASKDVSDTQMRVDVQYIKEGIQRIEQRTAPAQAQPQIVYLPVPQGQQVSPPARASAGGP